MQTATTDRARPRSHPVTDTTREAARITETGLRRYPELRAVSISCEEGTLRLAGCVRSFYLKQLAQTIALRAADGDQVANDVQVRNGR
jgi:osmotically-inducible protein OsmY